MQRLSLFETLSMPIGLVLIMLGFVYGDIRDAKLIALVLIFSGGGLLFRVLASNPSQSPRG